MFLTCAYGRIALRNLLKILDGRSLKEEASCRKVVKKKEEEEKRRGFKY